MWVRCVNAVNFVQLPYRKLLDGVQTPPVGQQSLPPEHFVDARNAAMKRVDRIEKSRIAIGYFTISGQSFGHANVPIVYWD